MGIKTNDREKVAAQMAAYQQRLSEVAKDCPVAKWQPLRSWPAARHPRQADMDAAREVKSLF